jgi:hypothetical protein
MCASRVASVASIVATDSGIARICCVSDCNELGVRDVDLLKFHGGGVMSTDGLQPLYKVPGLIKTECDDEDNIVEETPIH